MGLDNGIILHSRNMIKAKDRSECITSLGAHDDYNDGPEFDYEICYWRKCHNIRRLVAHVFDLPLDYVHKDNMDIGDIKQIWHIINALNNARVWNEGCSMWTYEEMHDHLDRDLLALEWLIHFMRTHKEEDYTVEFYDSY